MRMRTKSAFALAGVLTLALAGCVGDADDVGANGDDAADETAENGEAAENGGNGENGDNGAENGAADFESLGGEPLLLGLVPSGDVDQMVEDADAVGEQLSAELDGYPVDTFVADNYAGLVTAMQTGDAHIGMFGPIALVQAVDVADAVATLQAIRFGSSEYVTQWFTNDPDTYCMDEPVDVPFESDGEEYPMLFCNGTDSAESGPVGEEALELIEEGTTISYVDESSASGYYYPATQLHQLNGYDPAGDAIDGQFAGNHDASVMNVYNGDIAIGTSYDDARTGQVENAADVGEEVVVFAWSESIPNDGVAIAGDHVLTSEEREAITNAFLAFGSEDLGDGDPLYDVYEIEGLVEADLDALDVARDVAANFGDG